MRHQRRSAVVMDRVGRSFRPVSTRPVSRCTLRRAALVVIVLLVGLTGAAGVAQAQPPPETIEYYATDALGSVRVVFTPTGQVLGRSDYLPFGETLNQSGALPRQRFTGQERDDEAGLDYFNARSLQTRTGRMNRPDPLFGNATGDPQAWNRYAYVANNPLRFTDPSGMQTFKVLIVGHQPEYPPEQMSEAAMEGFSDLLAGAGGNSWYEWLSGGTNFFPFFGKHGSPGADNGQKPSPPTSPPTPTPQPSTLSVAERQKVYAEVVKPALRDLFKIPGQWEWGTTVCRKGNCFYAMTPRTDFDSGSVRLAWCASDETTIAFLHRHTTSDQPSGIQFYNTLSDVYMSGVSYPNYLFYMVGNQSSIWDYSAGYMKGPYDSIFR